MKCDNLNLLLLIFANKIKAFMSSIGDTTPFGMIYIKNIINLQLNLQFY